MNMFSRALTFVLLMGLSACAKSVWAPDDAIAKAAYSNGEKPSITLLTVIGNRSGEGGHSAIMINASQRVIFDPAGNWKHPWAPERNDLAYGITPSVYQTYLNFHSRNEWHMVIQTKEVSAEVAEMAFKSARENGAVDSALCANATTHILSGLPGFESIKVSLSPKKTMKQFGELAGVTSDKFYQYD